MSENDCVEADGRRWQMVRLLGKGKGGHSWLVEADGEHRVFKRLHYEPCAYYHFEGNKTALEIAAWTRLSTTGIDIPKLYAWDEAGDWILKEYVEGPTAAELAASGSLTEEHFRAVFAMASALYRHGINIDFFPTNFVCTPERMCYVDYECNDLIEEWNLENWGIYFWLNGEGMREHLAQGHSDKLCLPGSAKPVIAPFAAEAERLIGAYGWRARG